MSKKKIIITIILVIIILLIGYFTYKIIRTTSDNKHTKEEINKIKEEVIIETPEENPKEDKIDDSDNNADDYKLPLDFEKLKKINSDTVAWIKINNTNIDYPVVKTSNNTYYLDHSFYKQRNVNGWIFENSENASDFSDDNTVIFGHNTNGYTMFSEIKDIYNGTLGTTVTITIYLENDKINYKVFSVYLEKPDNTSNISKYLNQDIIDYMKGKSKITFDVDANEGDKILTLSTCNNITNDRLVLHAKKM